LLEKAKRGTYRVLWQGSGPWRRGRGAPRECPGARGFGSGAAGRGFSGRRNFAPKGEGCRPTEEAVLRREL
jgi:hypothetical protein